MDIPDNLAVLVFTLNEEINLRGCLESLQVFPNIFVVDSGSKDSTKVIAEELGANFISFNWNGQYPRKRQWALLEFNKYKWILFVDADERVNQKFIDEIVSITKSNEFVAAKSHFGYIFQGKKLIHGQKLQKIVLIKSGFATYPNVEPPNFGYGDLEFHYQPQVRGKIYRMKNSIIHNDQSGLEDWVVQHLKYARVEAELRKNPELYDELVSNKTRQGKLFFKLGHNPLIFFLVTYILRFGFLDGKAGLQNAIMRTWYFSYVDAISSD